ncbi:phytanoyl-CoA dioxygenase family protein [Kribbella sp. NPDC000426]|uniref:phytanoyl-CoA dioxygenase family protein n=1 Tax=Kribbella sp. NPDC000426 TaxID=3154255 RepID=UPI0033265A73
MTGYVLLPEMFTAPEIDRLWDVAEQVHAEVVAAAEAGETTMNVWPDGHRLETVHGTTIHWEPDAIRKAVRSLSPVAHLHPALAIVMLDDNTAANGAMQLIPADRPVRRDPLDPTGLLVDPTVVDEDRAVTVEAPAGSVLMFHGLTVHRSAPNRTATDRRSLLYCFQPAGRPELSALHYNPERLADLP